MGISSVALSCHRSASIYGLFDPRTSELFYVGVTTRPLHRRLGSHVHDSVAVGNPSSRCHRIREISLTGHRVEIDVLETVPFSEWVDAEQYWIAYFRYLGADLTNISLGGPGALGTRQSEKTKMLRSKAAAGRDMSAVRCAEVREIVATKLRHRIEVNGAAYDGIAAASRALGIPTATLQYRLDVGLAKRLTPRKNDNVRKLKGGLPRGERHPNARAVLINDVRYGTVAGAARSLDVNVSTMHKWLKSGRARYA